MIKINLNKYLKFFVVTTLVFSNFGCVSTLKLNKYPSNDIFLSINSNNRDSISYEITSNLEQNHKETDMIIPINSTFSSYIGNYMSTKFNKITGNSEYKIKYNIENLVLSGNYESDLGSSIARAISGGTGGQVGTYTVDAQFIVNVDILRSGQVIAQKKIFSNSNHIENVYKSNTYTYRKDAYQKTMNQVLENSVIMIDKYLASIGM